MLSVDFETCSHHDLGEGGAHNYAAHPTTDILCISFRDGMMHSLWHPKMGKPLPPWVLEHIRLGLPLAAWNARFECLIWQHIGVPRYGFPPIPHDQWYCTMSAALAMGLPAKLSKCASFMLLPEQKDTVGAKVMQLLCQPDKKTGKIPQGTAVQLGTLYDYCAQDTLTEETIALAIRPLQALERPVWLLDQQINDYGILVDRPLAIAAQALWLTYSAKLIDEYRAIMQDDEVAPSMVARLKTWLQAELALPKPIDSLNEANVTELLSTPTLPPHVRRALEIRQLLAGAAVKKYARFESYADCPDSRARGVLFYHSASTGRWSSKSIQVQNLIRPTIEAAHVPLAKQLTLDQDIDGIELFFGSVSDVLGSLCRATIVAPPGKDLLIVDYSNIEARVSAWLAGQESLLADFRLGRDPYISMAAKIFTKQPQDITKHERFIGKSAILGCLAGDTEVLTNHGWKHIVDVTLTDKIWDGEEWHIHMGLVNQGTQATLSKDGVRATPDHLFLTPNGWQQWGSVATDPQDIKKATELAATLLSGTSELESSTDMRVGASVGLSRSFSNRTWKKVLQQGVLLVQGLRVGSQTPTKPACLIAPTEKDYSIGYQHVSVGAITLSQKSTSGTVQEAYQCTLNGLLILDFFLSTCRPLWGGIYQRTKWIASKMMGAMNLAISSSSPTVTTLRSTDRSDLKFAPCAVARTSLYETVVPTAQTNVSLPETDKDYIPVYDLANAGPRNRFTIRSSTTHQPFVVHNCSYSMGAAKFQAAVKQTGNVDITDEFAKKCIDIYREEQSDIITLWRTLEQRIKRAIQTKEHTIINRYLTAHMDTDKWLVLTLPNGRYLSFYEPRLSPNTKFPGTEINFIGVDPQSNNRRHEKLFGGKLLENVTQAVSRDVMVDAMLRLTASGRTVTMTVHDELVLEGDPSDLSAVETMMRMPPVWAPDLPIQVEGYTSKFYWK